MYGDGLHYNLLFAMPRSGILIVKICHFCGFYCSFENQLSTAMQAMQLHDEYYNS